jgi:hypothetical protein
MGAMQNDIKTNRTWLYKSTLNTNAVDTVSVLTPTNDTNGITSFPIQMTWHKAKNATAYVVEYDNSISFSNNPHDTIVTDTVFYASKVLSHHKYYWRVLGFQPGNTCSGWSATFKLRTGDLVYGTGTIEPDAHTIFKIYPNPVIGHSFVLQYVHPLGNEMTGTIDILNINGQIVSHQSYTMVQGDNIIQLPASLSTGTYMVRFVSGSTRYVKTIQIIK